MTATVYDMSNKVILVTTVQINHEAQIAYGIPVALGWTPGIVKTWQDSPTEYRLLGPTTVRVVIS